MGEIAAMKNIYILCTRQEVGNTYLKDLQNLFSGMIHMRCLSVKEPPADRAQIPPADLVLVTNPDQVGFFADLMVSSTYIISVDFGYSLKSISQLRALPMGTRAMLGTSFAHIQKSLLRIFFEQGINQVVWVDGEDSDYDVLIADNLTIVDPNETHPILYLSGRRLSFQTLIQIAQSADLLNQNLEGEIFRYTQAYRSSMSVIPLLYSGLASSHFQLDTILNSITDGIAILNRDFCITRCNTKFVSLLPNSERGFDEPLTRLPEGQALGLESGAPARDKLVTVGCNNLIVSLEPIATHFEQEASYVLILQRMQDLERREKSLQQQLSAKGYTAKYSFQSIHAVSGVMRRCMEKAERIAKIDKTTLVVGDSGVGKELMVQAIHTASDRRGYPFVSINCAALPQSLLESELFGYAEGAFTGSRRGGKKGLFEQAKFGTLFLDEIGELSLEMQSKLLRAIETKEIMRVGGNFIEKVDVRIIAATNRNLKEMVHQKQFRLDLYYRLNTIVLRIPALRERREDIPVLTNYFIRHETGSSRRISPELQAFLLHAPWEGNVRELRNVIEYMVNITDGTLGLEHLPDYICETWEGDAPDEAFQLPLSDQYSAGEIREITAILRLVQQGCTNRGQIVQEMRELFPCTQYKIRKYLEDLRGRGWVCFGRGPAGIRMTSLGGQMLEHTGPQKGP